MPSCPTEPTDQRPSNYRRRVGRTSGHSFAYSPRPPAAKIRTLPPPAPPSDDDLERLIESVVAPLARNVNALKHSAPSLQAKWGLRPNGGLKRTPHIIQVPRLTNANFWKLTKCVPCAVCTPTHPSRRSSFEGFSRRHAKHQ